MAGQLVVIAGPDQGKVFPIRDGQTLVLGRGQASDTQINDPRMSRIHCRVLADGDKLILIDADSTGGTYFQRQRVQKAEVPYGSVFQVGDTQVRFQLEGSADASTLMGMPGMATHSPPFANEHLKELVGTTISRYRLDSIIAEGLSGVVFKGLDTEKNRPVAVKVLKEDVAESDEQTERFIRAMNTMMPIRHPNIVRLYYAGKTGKYCWAAMEYVDGESLAKVIERVGVRGMLDWKEVFRVAVDVGRALEESCSRKIIHRNVTPTNILRRHADRKCLLADLMLAKALEGSLARQVTQPGRIVGNLAYLSPERTRDEKTIDQRSDLYSLGATLYALLTGKPPFENSSMPELVRMIRTSEPSDPKQFQLAINDRFRDVVLQLLQKRPEDRYQTPSALMKDLERIATYNVIPMD